MDIHEETLQREDMAVIATMIDATCLPSHFSIHRNRRALTNIFPLGPFSNNHEALFPLFDPVCQLIALQNGDEGINALALCFLADCCNGRSEYRTFIALQGGLIRGVSSCLGGSLKHGVRTIEAVCAASLLRNVIANDPCDPYLLNELEENDAETAAVNLLAVLRQQNFEQDCTVGNHAGKAQAQAQAAKGVESKKTEEGGASSMNTTALSMYNSAVEVVCHCLCNLASLGDANRRRIVQADGVEVLLGVMLRSKNSCNEVQSAAADALGNLAIDNDVGETLLATRKSSVLFTMAMHESDIKVAKTASACLANITSLHLLHKHRVVTTGISFLQRINGAAVKEMVRKRVPRGEDDAALSTLKI